MLIITILMISHPAFRWGLERLARRRFQEDTPYYKRGHAYNNKMSFQEWLDQQHKDLQILVREHPTVDSQPIPYEQLSAIATDVLNFISAGRTVVVMDSGGVGRTGAVCKYMKATEDTPRS